MALSIGGAFTTFFMVWIAMTIIGGLLNPVLKFVIGGTIKPVGFAILAAILSFIGVGAGAFLGKLKEYGEKGGSKWMQWFGKHGWYKTVGITLIAIALARASGLTIPNPVSYVPYLGRVLGGTLVSFGTPYNFSWYLEMIGGALLILLSSSTILDKIKGTASGKFPLLGKAVSGSAEIATYVENFKQGTMVNDRLRYYLAELSDMEKLLREEKSVLAGRGNTKYIEDEIARIIESEGGFDATVKEALKQAMQKENIPPTDDVKAHTSFILKHFKKKEGIKVK